MHIHSFDSSFSGQGYHGFIPLASIYVSECPDISERIKEFQQGIRHEFDKDLNRLEVILDNTADLARKVKIPGTKKPEIGILSKWYGGDKRVEDQGMRGWYDGIRK